MKLLQDEIKQKEEYLESRKLLKSDLEKQYTQIINSRFYNKWQQVNKIKKIINPHSYINYINSKIKKYKYSPNNFEMPHHDFIVLKQKTDKWRTDGFEKVGEDWHIKVIRIKDNKTFLLDQPLFYLLQIYKNSSIDTNKELFITYGTTPATIKKIELVIKRLKL